MPTAYATVALPAQPFERTREQFADMEAFLTGPGALGREHGEIEAWIKEEGTELLRRFLDEFFALRASLERRIAVVGDDDVERDRARPRARQLETLFGTVTVPRLSYGAEGMPGLRPLDCLGNLPPDHFSHGLRAMVAREAAQGSFDEVVARVEGYTGGRVGKRQGEELAVRAAVDFDGFYMTRERCAEDTWHPLVISTDAKGISMRLEDLREGTRQAAERDRRKIETRLSPGEKKNRKRMAQVTTVYTVAPFPRTAADIVHGLRNPALVEKQRPKPTNKRVWASVEMTPRRQIRTAFEEAMRRDPERRRPWIVLVDGEPKQLKAVRQEARRAAVQVIIILDIVHVIERLWDAARALFDGSTHEAESWVGDRLLALLTGSSGGDVARQIRRTAKIRHEGLSNPERKAIATSCRYLADRTRTRLMRYDRAITMGLPIATGVVEGACRYLVKDRMDRTGARWSLEGAEAVLRLRAIWASGHFDAYWDFHLAAEKQRNHASKYSPSHPLSGALPAHHPHLRRVK